MKILAITTALALVASASAHAAFIVDNDINQDTEIRATLDPVGKKAPETSDLGTIVSLHDLSMAFNAPAQVFDNTIGPVGDNLTSVTFTPANSRKYTDFSFVSQQITNEELLTLTVQDSHGNPAQTFTIPTGAFSENMHRFGIEATHGDTIQSITINDSTGFHELKLPEFSVSAIPEPKSYALMLVGVGLVGAAMRRSIPVRA